MSADGASFSTNDENQNVSEASFFLKNANFIYAATTFLSACLMFTLQPMFAKMLTPMMGGTPAVWNTALVFYQATLLIGYFYAHVLATKFTIKQQLFIHFGLLVIGLLFLPVKVTQLVGTPNVSIPVLWTFGALALSIGAPIIAISATAPLVQAWRARIGDKVNPYRLYAASNLGSFIALAAYPFLIEPLIGAKMQSYVWAGVYVVLAILLFLAIKAVPENSKAPIEVATSKTTWRERLKWIAFSAPPSALLVAVTTHIVTDVASVPLLWIPPLALFLLTFVIAFSDIGDQLWEFAAPLKYLVVFILAAVMAADADSDLIGLGIHLLAFFVIVLCCHLELSHNKPEHARLTEFYLWMSVGGVLGGAFSALLAPVIFNTTIEFQIILAVTLLIAPWEKMEWKWAAPALLIAALGVGWFICKNDIASYLDASMPILSKSGLNEFFWAKALLTWHPEMAGAILCAIMALAAAFVTRSSALVAGLGALALLVPVIDQDTQSVKFRERSFFGILKIQDYGEGPTGWRYLSNGTTLHGVMSLDPARNREPMSYYWHETPIGLFYEEATEAKPKDLHAGVIGLGMGSTTCYAKPGQDWRVFEINKQVLDASLNPNLVGFVNRCAPQAQIILGDARLSMAQQPDKWFDIVLVDAFTSDAIPTHMITKEAIAMMMSKIKDDGVLVVHISNRYLGLQHIVADGAHANGYAVMDGSRDGDENNNADTGVRAIIIAHNEDRLARYMGPIWTHMYPRPNAKPWTDDHTDIIQALIDNYE